ncbi:CDP-alcohol phosphatidyltransferase family protein [Kineococcus sp. DHX-1]|uniref:CDP-alcohol phosphatidyltransferase family protein n=1 Tax=Kineococcus sp. DHX-1 TaxID=3349638 RepID=UPI0036D291E7
MRTGPAAVGGPPTGPGTGVRDAWATLVLSTLLCTALVTGSAVTGSFGVALEHGTAVAAGVALVAGAAVAVARRRDRWCGPADRVTLARTVLVGGCATVAVLALSGVLGPRPWLLVALAVPALLLDGVDGHVARRTGTATAAGARLDMEVDAALLLVLSAVAALTQGPWVLAIGLLRYAYVAAGWCWVPLRRTPSPRFSRKVVAVVQAVALLTALLPPVPPPAGAVVLAVALAALVFSFGRDVRSLHRRTPQVVLDPVDGRGPALADAQAEPVRDLRLVEVGAELEGGGHPRSRGHG